jgi:ABC-type nitrate/sulfonate/bicarbonate transport system substrate-binding protein
MAYRRRSSHVPILTLTLLVLAAPLGARATPGPGASPEGSAMPVTLVPEDTTITIGSSDASLVGLLPLVVAETRGYLREAGFEDVQVVQVEEPLPGLLNGSLDLAILDARQATDAYALGLPVRAVAGHRVVPVPDVATRSPWPSLPASLGASPSPDASPSPGASASASPAPASPWAALDIVVAATDTVSSRPGTVAAFTMAYVRALEDIRSRVAGPAPGASASPQTSPVPGPSPSASLVSGSSPSASLATYGDPLLDAAAAAGLEVTPDLLATWPEPLGMFLPFDGGFDDPAIGDGLGSLRNLYLADPGSMPDLGSFVSTGTLHAAQQALGLPPNPQDGSAVTASPSPAPSTAVGS